MRRYFREASPEERSKSTAISALVFLYFRWKGWLDMSLSIEHQIAQARRNEIKLDKDSNIFNKPELERLAIPRWVPSLAHVSAQWLKTLLKRPSLWIRVRRGSTQDIQDSLKDCSPNKSPDLSRALRYEGYEDLFKTNEFGSGSIDLQDIASQAVSIICAPKSGESWWDACAGIGGKTLHLSDLMGNKGVILATDRSAGRLKQLKQRLARGNSYNYKAKHWPKTDQKPTRAKFDGILVDAPCSGIGTWGVNPHAKWTTTPKDVTELATLQRELLDACIPQLKIGGRLVYSVCTITNAETKEICDYVAERYPQLKDLPFNSPFSAKAIPAARTQFWPQQTLGNGMFVASWTKTK